MSNPLTKIMVKDGAGTYNDLSDIFKQGTRTASKGTGITLNGTDLNQMFAAYDAARDLGYDTKINGNDGNGNYVDLRTLFSQRDFTVSNFTVLNTTSTTITIGWTTPTVTSGFLGYNLSLSTSGGTPTITNIGITSSNIYTIIIPTLTTETQYTIGLQALYTNYAPDYSYINVTIQPTSTEVTVNTATSSTAANYAVTNVGNYTYITTNSLNTDININLTSATKIGFLLVGGGGSGAVNGIDLICGGAGGGGGGICYMDILNSQINTSQISIRVGSGATASTLGSATSANKLFTYPGGIGNYSKIYFGGDITKYIQCNGGKYGDFFKSKVNDTFSIGGSGGTVDVSGITNVVAYTGGNGGYGVSNANITPDDNYRVNVSIGKNGKTVTIHQIDITKSVGGGGGGCLKYYNTALPNIRTASSGATIYGGGNGQRAAVNPIPALIIGSGQATTGGGGGGGIQSSSASVTAGLGGSGYGLIYFFKNSNNFVLTYPVPPIAPSETYIYGYSPTDITIAFTEPAGTVTSYTMTAVPTTIGDTITKTFNAPATYYTIRGLDTTKIYNISLTATNLIGTSDPTTIGFDKTLLATGLTVTAQTSNTVTIGWTSPTTTTSTLTGYNISINGSITNIATANSYQIPSLTTDTPYKIGIQAVYSTTNANANYIYIEGSITSGGTAFTYKTPLPPTGLSILGYSSTTTTGSIRISFTEPVDTVISYTVTVTPSSGTAITQTFNAPNKYYSINDNLFANLTSTTNITYTISLVSKNYVGQSTAITYAFNPTLFVSNITMSNSTVSWISPTTTATLTGYNISTNGNITTIGLVNTYTVGGLIDGLYVVGIKAIYSDTNKNASAGYSYINVTGKNVENTVTLVSGSVSTTNNNGYKVITATSTASFTLLTNTKIGFILVGGGGGGGANGSNFGSCGGGGGGATYYMNYNNSTINTNNINITVGTGGAGYGSPTVRLANTLASNGSSGSFSKIYFSGDSSKYVTCNGGAFGNCDKSGVAINKGIGGVGGTVAASGITGGTSTSGGNGGSGYGYVNVDGTKGKNGTTITDTILSTTYYYGGGGGGGAWNLMSDVANASEACYGATIYGGGNGGRRSQPELLELLSSNGVLNTGGGGGGGSAYNGSGAGANGICLVYFPIIGFIISSFDYLPSAPTDLSVSTISTSIKISFKEPTETVTSYTVTAVTLNNTSVTKTFYAPATAYTFSNTDLGNSMYYTISLVASNSFGSSSPITITISPELFNPIATVPSLVNGYYADTYRTYSSVTLGTSILDGYWGSSLDKAGLAVSGYSSTTKGQGAWKPLNTDTTPWIKLDLTQNFIVTGITVKPRMSASLLTVVTGNEYVQTLKIETSTDNITFTSMTTNGTNTTFNTGIIAATSTTVDNTDTAYYIPIYGVSLARYVKVSPLSWNKAGQPALRVGVNYLIS